MFPRPQMQLSTSLKFAAVALTSVLVVAPASGQYAPQISIAAAIADADRDGTPDLRGERVRLTGTVTSPVVSLGGMGVVSAMQADAGILLYTYAAEFAGPVEVGDQVEVTGVLEQFRGQEMIVVEVIDRIGRLGEPDPVRVPIAVLGETFSARLVAVRGRLNVREVDGQLVGSLTDASGTLPVIFPAPVLTDPARLRAILKGDGRQGEIRGLLLQDVEEAGAATGYYLSPRGPDDLRLPGVLPIIEIIAGALLLGLAGIATHLGRRRRTAEAIACEQAALADRLRKSEAALRTSEQRYRSLFENVPIGLYQTTPDGRILSANGALCRILAFPSPTQLLASGADAWFADPRERERFMRELTAADSVSGFETEWLRADGTIISVRKNARAIRGDDDRIGYYESTVEDVTARRLAEERLKDAEARVRQLVGTSPTIIYAVSVRDGVAGLSWISDSVTRMLGYPAEQTLGVSWWVDCLHPDDRDRVSQSFVRFLGQAQPGDHFTDEYRFRHQDGSYRWFRNDMRVVSREGTELEAVGASLDISAQKEVTLALAEAEARYRRLVETSPYGIVTVDADGRLTEVNLAVSEIFGREPQELVGLSARELVAPDSHRTIRAEMERVRHDPSARSDYEAWILRPSGERRLVHIRSTPIVSGGRIEGAHGVIRDITDERSRENRLQLLGAALENLGHGVAVHDSAGQIIYANGAFRKILALEGDEQRMPAMSEFLPDEAAVDQMREIDESLQVRGRWSGRVWRKRAGDGRIIPLDTVIGMVPGPVGSLSHALVICNDASETLQHEQQLRRAERLSSLGTLVGGVAHELNNPLNAVINFAALLLTQARDEEEREDLATIVREGERAARIVANLRVIARQAEIEKSPKEPVDLNDVVGHVLKLRSYSLNTSNIRVEAELARRLPRIWGDRGQMEQVLLNLVINAEQAIAADRGSGTVRLVTRQSRGDVLLEVADDGPGIPSSCIDRIFDPFWTTKPPGEGTGLGLSLVHNIVTEHGGAIDVHSTLGTGTTFHVQLPGYRSGQAEPPSEHEDPEGAAGLRVLVVDDEPAVRRSLVRYLAGQGYDVDEASEGGEALRLLRDRGGYDVILSDLRMPGINGEQLFERLKADGSGHDRRVVFMTGDASGVDTEAISQEAPLLIKPIKLADVGRAIRARAAEGAHTAAREARVA